MHTDFFKDASLHEGHLAAAFIRLAVSPFPCRSFEPPGVPLDHGAGIGVLKPLKGGANLIAE